jgi:hypothetical protein
MFDNQVMNMVTESLAIRQGRRADEGDSPDGGERESVTGGALEASELTRPGSGLSCSFQGYTIPEKKERSFIFSAPDLYPRGTISRPYISFMIGPKAV